MYVYTYIFLSLSLSLTLLLRPTLAFARAGSRLQIYAPRLAPLISENSRPASLVMKEINLLAGAFTLLLSLSLFPFSLPPSLLPLGGSGIYAGGWEIRRVRRTTLKFLALYLFFGCRRRDCDGAACLPVLFDTCEVN